MRLIIVIVAVCLLSGCSFSFNALPKACCLQEGFPTNEAKASHARLMDIDFVKGDNTLSMRVQLEVQEQKTVLVGFTPFGTRSFTLVQEGYSYSTDIARFAQMPIEPIEILCQLRLVLTSTEELQRCCGSSWSVTEQGDRSRGRIFHQKGQERIKIAYKKLAKEQLSATLLNKSKGYQLSVQTLDYYEL